QYRSKKHGVLAQFDFAAIADSTRHPFRVQCEQSKLTRILYEQLRGRPDFELRFHSRVAAVAQNQEAVTVTIDRNGSSEAHCGRWLIGADGARSEGRRAPGKEVCGVTLAPRLFRASAPVCFSRAVTA